MNISTYITYLIIIVTFGCKENKSQEKTEKVKNPSQENHVIFEIDKRTEFLRTIYNIAVQEEFEEDIKPCQTEYLKRVNNHFLQFKNHPLIKAVYDNQNIGIDFPTIGLMFEDLEHFKFDKAYSKELKLYHISEQTIDSLRPLMIDFYKKSAFGDFFEDNEQYYQKAISKIENQVSDENLFDKVTEFYQSKQNGLELIVFVELTNNANNKAVDFYDNYNPKKRAMILGNYCDFPNEVTSSNEIMELDNSIRAILYHETSHLFTSGFLEKYIGDLDQYRTICEDCNELKIRDEVDHMIVRPLQAVMMERFDNNTDGSDYYLNEVEDVTRDVYKRLTEYRPENKIAFEKTYIDCLNLIKKSASEQ